LIDSLNNYFVFAIQFIISIIRSQRWIQKSPKNRPKAKTFQITVTELLAVRLKTLFVVSELLYFRNNNPQWEPKDVTVNW